jgi:hypothetical protein
MTDQTNIRTAIINKLMMLYGNDFAAYHFGQRRLYILVYRRKDDFVALCKKSQIYYDIPIMFAIITKEEVIPYHFIKIRAND